MVDRAVFDLARTGIDPAGFDRTADRCHLGDGLVREATARLHASIDRERIDRQVQRYVRAVEQELPFAVV